MKNATIPKLLISYKTRRQWGPERPLQKKLQILQELPVELVEKQNLEIQI